MPGDIESIVSLMPGVVRAARRLYEELRPRDSVSTTPPKTAEALTLLDSRMAVIERHEAEQAEVVEHIAEQLEGLAAGSKTLNRRVTFALWLAGIALLVSLGAALLVLLR